MNIFKTTSASNRLISAPTVGMITVVAWLFFGLVNPTPASSIVVIAGAVILAAAFVLVFNAAIALLRNPTPKPFYVPTIDDFAN